MLLSAAATAQHTMSLVMQVLQDYCAYADPMIGRWHVKDDGHKHPNVRGLAKPLLNLFHGERGNKRWKAEIDKVLLQKPPPETVSELMDRTLHMIDDSALDSPPEDIVPLYEPFAAEQTGKWPPPELPELLCLPCQAAERVLVS